MVFNAGVSGQKTGVACIALQLFGLLAYQGSLSVMFPIKTISPRVDKKALYLDFTTKSL